MFVRCILPFTSFKGYQWTQFLLSRCDIIRDVKSYYNNMNHIFGKSYGIRFCNKNNPYFCFSLSLRSTLWFFVDTKKPTRCFFVIDRDRFIPYCFIKLLFNIFSDRLSSSSSNSFTFSFYFPNPCLIS